jgi:hypothetical protein
VVALWEILGNERSENWQWRDTDRGTDDVGAPRFCRCFKTLMAGMALQIDLFRV